MMDPLEDPKLYTRYELPQFQDSAEYPNMDTTDLLDFESCIGDHINGCWSGFLLDANHKNVGGVIQFRVSDWKAGSFTGEGAFFGGTLRVEGTFYRDTGKLEAIIVGTGDAWSVGLDKLAGLHVSLSGAVGKLSVSTIYFPSHPRCWEH